jgi:hypothetical protein
MIQFNRYILFITLLLFISCEPEIKELKSTAGEADFSVFVSVGCSKTAGFTNNELYKSGQIVSFPNIISRQLLHVGGGEFIQPLMKDENGFGKKLKLAYTLDCKGDSVLEPMPTGGIPDETNVVNIYKEEGPFHNFGVPGAKIQHLSAAANFANSAYFQYYSRFASSPASNLLDDAVAVQPTFYSLWIGNSDIMDYAFSGGKNHEIIDKSTFELHLTEILEQLSEKATGGIIGNIPDILLYPYFSYITTEGLWVEDLMEPMGKRLIKEGEKVLFPVAEQIKCAGMGTENYPIPDNRYLSLNHVKILQDRINEFNTIIKGKALEYNLAFIDVNTLIKSAQHGLVYEGITFNNQYITGGLFSIDGFSLTRRGNAIIANAFIDAINNRYKSSIPRISVSQFQGIEFP